MNQLDIEELVTGVKKANLDELKELKVKLPVRLLVNLHYVKLTQSRAISEVVNEALTQYFAELPTSQQASTSHPAPAPNRGPALLGGHVLAPPSLLGTT